MKIAILGYGVEGQSAYQYWKTQGAEITICDQDSSLVTPEDVTAKLGPDYLKGLVGFDLICRTASINPGLVRAANPGMTTPITTVINEFLRACPTRNIIGITGTKGKGTTSTLTTKMLEAAGKQVHLGGNIGVSPLDFLPDLTPDSWVVLELSSFQLMDIERAPRIAVCLMVVPEHLNWHEDIGDYTNAKSQLFAHQTSGDTAIYFADNTLSHKIASHSPGAKIPFYANPGAYIADGHIVIDDHQICHVDELKLLGEHNWQNACAAVTAVWQTGVQDPTAIRSVLTTFSGLEHRLEFVRDIDGIQYYDDSFGTTPETAIVAIQAFKQPKVVILGGSDKGVQFDELAKTVAASNVRHAVLIGETASAIEAALRNNGFSDVTRGGDTMPDIVNTAAKFAKKGDVVLLSTGCASFGLFKDYKDRGNQFKLSVGAL